MQKKTDKEILVLVINLNLNDEIELALNEDITIVSSFSGIEYFVNKTVNILRECFQN